MPHDQTRNIPERLPSVPADHFFPGGREVGTGCGHVVLEFSGRLDAARLARAARLLLDSEPILGCRFVERAFLPYWERLPNLAEGRGFRLIETAEIEKDLARFLASGLDRSLDPQTAVCLLRGDADTLCVKYHHACGDATSMLEAVYDLARIYRRLEQDPDFQPAPHLNGSRSLGQIAMRFGLRDRWRVLRKCLQNVRERRKLFPGPWAFPPSESDADERHFLKLRIPAERVAVISRYARKRLATVNSAVLAAFYRSLHATVPRVAGRPVILPIPINLRQYLPDSERAPVGNLIGAIRVVLQATPDSSLDEIIDEIRRQSKQRGDILGLDSVFFVIEAFAPLRWLLRCLPLPLVTNRTLWMTRKLVRGGNAGIAFLSSGGELDRDRLDFGGVRTLRAYGTSGVPFVPGALIIGSTSFEGALTLTLGFSEKFLSKRIAQAVLDGIDRELPA